MLSALKPVVFIALLSASAFASPHEARSARHHAIAARQPLTGVHLNPSIADVQPVKSKKAKRKVCRPRKTSSLLAASSTAVSTTVAATSSSSSVESSASSTESSTSSKTTEKSSSSTKVVTTSSTSATPTSTVEKTTSSTHSEEPKTTQAPPPPPETTTQKPTSTSTSKEVKTTSKSDDNNNSGNGGYVPAQGSQSFLFGKQTGDATFYDTGLTACGKSFSNSDYIVAVSQLLFDTFPGAGANPNLNPICGKRIRASMPGGGSVEVTVQDRCTGCSMTSLDFTPDAFNHLGDQSQGRLHGMTWEWIP